MYLHNMADFRVKIRQEKTYFTYEQLEEMYGVNRYYLWHIINNDDYVPPEWAQNRLGIRVYKPAPVCVKCGEVHVTKRCTKNDVQPVRRWRDLPPELLRLALEYRG